MANINDTIREMFPGLEPRHPLDRRGGNGRLVSGVVFILLVSAITVYVSLAPDRNVPETESAPPDSVMAGPRTSVDSTGISLGTR